MKRIWLIGMLCLLAGLQNISVAQKVVLLGKVVGINGNIAGATVQASHSDISVQTQADGTFSIEIPQGVKDLQISYKKMNASYTIAENLSGVEIFLIPSEKALYREVNNRKNIEICDLYLSNYPTSKRASAVINLKEQYYFARAYETAAAKFSDTALQNYLSKYPDGAYADKARQGIEVAAWQNARYENTLEAYLEYLNKYPEGMASTLAREKVAQLKK